MDTYKWSKESCVVKRNVRWENPNLQWTTDISALLFLGDTISVSKAVWYTNRLDNMEQRQTVPCYKTCSNTSDPMVLSLMISTCSFTIRYWQIFHECTLCSALRWIKPARDWDQIKFTLPHSAFHLGKQPSSRMRPTHIVVSQPCSPKIQTLLNKLQQLSDIKPKWAFSLYLSWLPLGLSWSRLPG